jgi:adenine-specific DNA-methyltransferase
VRSYLLSTSKLLEINLLPTNVFPDATVDTILIFTEKQKKVNSFIENNVKIRIFDKRNANPNIEMPEKIFSISTEKWFNQNAFNVQSDNNESILINKIDNQFKQLDSFVEMYSGVKSYEVGKGKPPQTREIVDLKPFNSDKKVDNNWQPCFDGKHIGYYELLWKENNWINYGNWLAAPRNAENFEGEKILIRKIISKTLIANYIPYTSYCNTLLFVLKLKINAKISYKSLLGILNSNFIGWYFRKKFQISNEDTFPQIMIKDILQFAVPNIKNELTEQIEYLVDTILLSKQTAPSVSTADLEREIDGLVYGLYGLTAAEIAVIEGAS